MFFATPGRCVSVRKGRKEIQKGGAALTIKFKNLEFESADEAIQHTSASGDGVAIKLRRERLVVSQEDADRLAAAGVEFAYQHDHEMPDGTRRIVTIPVN